MPKMRTIDQAAAWLRENDPECALTKTALRRLAVSGELPSVRVGQKYLINLETLVDFLRGMKEPVPASKIRRLAPEVSQ